MEDSFFDVVEFLKKPSLTETFVDILLCAVPIWLAVMIGLMIGWSWRPRWTGLVFLGLRSKFRFLWTAPPGFGARRLWLAFTALSAFTYWFNFKGKTKAKAQDPSPSQPDATDSNAISRAARSSDRAEEREQDTVTQADLEHFLHLLEGKDGVMDWQSFMERSTPNMQYKAWRYDPETGPTVYRSRTVFDDATPELVRDFFWDDDFRPKWDAMLAYCKVLEECPHNGTMISHWIKKFPFFCSDREYIIARRIWQAGNTYYCVTKGVPYPSLPKRDKPRRVELYFSSWVIKPGKNCLNNYCLFLNLKIIQWCGVSTANSGKLMQWNLAKEMVSCLHVRLPCYIMKTWGFPKMLRSWESGMECGELSRNCILE
ncbi:hypothetical protein AAZV13_11G007400 [Glycine max]